MFVKIMHRTETKCVSEAEHMADRNNGKRIRIFISI